MWNQVEHGIFRRPLPVGRILGVGHHESSRTTQGRLIVTTEALVAIKARPQAGRICLGYQLSLGWVDECAQFNVGAVIANRFELKRPLQALVE
jgi:hypothetical protein